MTFESKLTDLGPLTFPRFRSLRVMMMPFFIDDPLFTLPESLGDWRETVDLMLWMLDDGDRTPGVGYLTLDEVALREGEHHRRPGVHVDGVGDDGSVAGGWGGGGGWGAKGFLMASNAIGCKAWRQTFEGIPEPNGDCAPLASQCRADAEVILQPERLYAANALCVHESLPMPLGTKRQFVRLSMPSEAPWYEGYTPNPLGIQPGGPIRPARAAFLNYRK